MSLRFSKGGTSVTIVPDDIIEEEKSKKKEIAVPDGNPYFIPLGSTGPYIKIQGWLPESEADDLRSLRTNDVVEIDASIYDELSVGDEYYITDKKVNRKGGYCDRYRASISLTRKWY